MNRLDLLNYGPYINKPHFLDPQSPKAALNNSHEHYECGSPSNRKSLMMRRSILLPNGITLEKQIESIFSKQERTRTEAKLLYEAIKDFPFIKMLCNPIGDKNPLDYESIIHLIRSMKFLKVQTGDIVYSQEDPSDGKLYILYAGEIALLVKDPDLVTARNYERFETEQKKRTIVRLGSFNKDRDQRQKNARSHTPNVMERVNEEEEGEGEPNDHVFQLLKSYMTSNFIPQKKVKVEEAPESDEHKQHVEKDLARVSGITRAVVKFKKVLKQKNDILNVAKSYGIVRDRLEIGQYFGGSVMLEIKKREETAFAMNDCELLVISYKDLQLIKAIYSKKRIALRNFMFDSFPKLELYQSEKVVTGLLGTLEEKLFEANAQIVTEGQSGEYFYILQSGTCEISKEIIINEGHALDNVMPPNRSLLRVKPSTKKRVPLTTISQGVFFGDELIFHAQKYCYTVKVTSSKATVVAIKNKTFAARFPQVVFETMKNLYQNKCQNYLDIIKNLISSAQYENYELDSDLNLSYSEKKAALEKIDMKDLSAPLKLRTKNKKIPSSLYKAESNSARQTASAFGQRTSAPLSPLTARETKDIKDSTGTNDYQLKTPQQEQNKNGIYNFEEQAKTQPVTEKGMKPGHRPKNRSMGQPVTTKHSRGISQGGVGQNLQTLTPLHDEQAKDEELERVRELIRARTAINADVEGIRGGMLKKDHISYINSHRITNKGLIDMKMLEDAESKGLSARRETPTIENLKLEIDIDKSSRRKFLIQNMQSQSKSAADTPRSSTRRDDKDSTEELKSPRDVILPGIKDGEYKSSPFRKLQNRLKLEIGANEKEFRGNEMSNPASASQSHRAKDYGLTVSTPTLVRNQSFSTANTPFGKETNVFDIEIPKNINKYIAQKQHLKLKEKLFAGDLDESEIFGCNNIPSLPRTPTLHAKRDASLDLSRDKPLSSERSVRGTSAASMHRSYKPSGLSNFEKQAGETRRAEEKKDVVPMKKVEVGIVWKDKQSVMLKQKGKMYKQLTKKGEIKGIFPTLDTAPDFNRPLKSAKASY